MRTRLPFTIPLLAAAIAAGCGSHEETTVSPPVAAPAGSRWERASVEVAWHPKSTGATEFGIATTAACEIHTLILAGPKGEERFLISWKDEKTGIVEQLRWAPDGHALALSADEGRSWRYCWLTAAESPMFCDHLSVSGDPWAGEPKLRDVFLEVLRTATRIEPPASGVSHMSQETPRPGHDELGPAARFAIAHAADDPELRAAFAGAFFGSAENNTMNGAMSLLQAFVPDAVKLVREHDDVRAVFVAGLDSFPAANAALVLSQVPDRRSADALAAALTKACTGENSTHAFRFAWALARISIAPGGASETAVAAFECALAHEAAFLGPGPLPADETSAALCRSAASGGRRISVQGLAALAPAFPAARKTLEKLATGSRKRVRSDTGAVLEDPATLPGFALDVGDDPERERQRDFKEFYEAGCWARAALDRLDRKR